LLELAIVLVVVAVAVFVAVKIAKLIVRLLLIAGVAALLYFYAYPYVMELVGR
jgi:hypothetical protein